MTKSQVVLDRPIKAIGMHDVKIALHPEVAVTIKVNVARSPEEADLQAQGIDVMAQMFERDAAPARRGVRAPRRPTEDSRRPRGKRRRLPADAEAEAPADRSARRGGDAEASRR